MKKNLVVIYVLVFLVGILSITNTVLLVSNIENKATTSNNTNNQVSNVDVTDDVSKLVKDVKDSVVAVAIYENDKLVGNGSGAVIKKNGNKVTIVTNNHVASSGTSVKVLFPNGKEVDAKVLGMDEVSDIAVLEANVDFDVQPLKIGNSDNLQAGEPVIAIGSPFDLSFSGTVTKGIISGTDRVIESDANEDGRPDYQMKVLQTDAAINPGNSGGPLLNMAGELVGINTSKISATDFEGMGFSIPVNEVMPIVEQIEKNGQVSRPKLGIYMMPVQDLPPAIAEYIGLPQNVDHGIVVYNIIDGSAAAKAGMQKGDVIVGADGNKIDSTAALTSVLYSKKAGDTIKLEIIRDGKTIKIDVKL